MILFFYNLALVAILTVTAPWWLWKIATTRKYREGLKERLGEVPALFVVPRPGKTAENDALIAHCRTHLSAYKVPHSVQLIAEIPRTGSGKIIRYKLKETMRA